MLLSNLVIRNGLSHHSLSQLILGKEPLINVADVKGLFLTIFAVFSLESFAETLVVVVSVQWQTFTIVLTRPTATRCLSKECIMIIHMKFYISRNQTECTN